MSTTTRALLATAAIIALLPTGCARDITGTAVTAAGGAPARAGGDDGCTAVDAPLQDIPSGDASEPHLRIPVPQGWERNTMMDSEIIRYAIVAKSLITEGFAPNAVVTLESVRGRPNPDEVFEQSRGNLVSMLGAFDLATVTNTTCGFPSETTHYTAPPLGGAPERPIIAHAVVLRNGNATYLATLTIQTSDAQNPTYAADSQEIVDGFQTVLPVR